MSGQHLVLIVEDDRAIAEDLAEILESLGCASVTADNKEDALAACEKRKFCLVLLDLEIKLKPDSVKARRDHGGNLLRELRQLHPDHTGRCYWLPILIASGFARERDEALEAMRNGADDVIQKPFVGAEVTRAVRRAFDHSSRASHDQCSKGIGPAAFTGSKKIVLAIPGDRVDRRTRVMLGSRHILLTDSSIKLLLNLMIAYEAGKWVHKSELGARDDQGFKGVSVLREALKPALEEGVDVIANDHQGRYSLTDNVVIGACDAEKLVVIGDKKTIECARELGRLLNARSVKSDGNS